jgi:hypothetical protein|tara:strand:- start:677 stop:832 length:156 start_codon:yes stop_codon:yes gene_type:complete
LEEEDWEEGQPVVLLVIQEWVEVEVLQVFQVPIFKQWKLMVVAELLLVLDR